MTTPITPAKKRYGADEESMTEWFMLHKNEVSWALLGLVIIIGGFWYYERSQSIKAQRAETAYFQARQGVGGQADSALRKVADRYEGTNAGTQAAMTLAQSFYDQKKYKEGLDVLKKAESKSSGDFKPSIYVLEAAGHEQLKDFVAASEDYKRAAQVTRFPFDKAEYQATAARDLTTAGKLAEAKAIWTELAKDESGPWAPEARVRLGELDAKPMKI